MKLELRYTLAKENREATKCLNIYLLVHFCCGMHCRNIVENKADFCKGTKLQNLLERKSRCHPPLVGWTSGPSNTLHSNSRCPLASQGEIN